MWAYSPVSHDAGASHGLIWNALERWSKRSTGSVPNWVALGIKFWGQLGLFSCSTEWPHLPASRKGAWPIKRGLHVTIATWSSSSHCSKLHSPDSMEGHSQMSTSFLKPLRDDKNGGNEPIIHHVQMRNSIKEQTRRGNWVKLKIKPCPAREKNLNPNQNPI